MNWRQKRRRELLRLGVTDPALLTIRYYELADQCGERKPSANMPLGAMIDAILDEEEVLCHCGSHEPRTPNAPSEPLAERPV